jgi:hypothetical protein
MKSSRSKQFKTDGTVISLLAALGFFPILITVFFVANLCSDIVVQPAYAEPKNTSTTTVVPRSHTPSADKNSVAIRALLRSAPTGNGSDAENEDSGASAPSAVQKAAEMIRGQKASGGN